MKGENSPRGWYSRGYLPHFDGGSVRIQFITFRLADSLPASVLLRIREELEIRDPENISRETFILAEQYLDAGHGACFLKLRKIATIVRDAILKHGGNRYRLIAWVIMPNHVHLLLRPCEDESLEKILHSIKSFTASEANKALGRSGSFWMREAFDRYVRDEVHFRRVFRYIENNPVKAGLCEKPQDWEFSSAWNVGITAGE